MTYSVWAIKSITLKSPNTSSSASPNEKITLLDEFFFNQSLQSSKKKDIGIFFFNDPLPGCIHSFFHFSNNHPEKVSIRTLHLEQENLMQETLN